MSSGLWPGVIFPNAVFPKRVFPKGKDFDLLGDPVKEFEHALLITCFDALERKTDFDEVIV